MFAAGAKFCGAVIALVTFTSTTFAATAPKDTAALKVSCPDFTGRGIDAKAIGLPSRGGSIKSAEIATLGPASYCKIIGALAPVDPKSYPINFQINLPLEWNGRAVQYGG